MHEQKQYTQRERCEKLDRNGFNDQLFKKKSICKTVTALKKTLKKKISNFLISLKLHNQFTHHILSPICFAEI